MTKKNKPAKLPTNSINGYCCIKSEICPSAGTTGQSFDGRFSFPKGLSHEKYTHTLTCCRNYAHAHRSHDYLP